MRLLSLISGFVYLTSLLLASSAQDASNEDVGPQLEVTAAFPASNPFGHVVNGERNLINLMIENKSDMNVTLLSIAGAFRHANNDVLIKNTTAMGYRTQLLSGVKMEVGYSFYSEFKPVDVKLIIWMDAAVDKSVYRTVAYDSIVTIVEPEKSILDLKLMITYLIVSAILGGIIYAAYVTFIPQPKKPRRKQAAPSDATASTATATGIGYQEEWIPEHHLKKSKKVVLSSDEETSAADVSGKEGRKRKGKR